MRIEPMLTLEVQRTDDAGYSRGPAGDATVVQL